MVCGAGRSSGRMAKLTDEQRRMIGTRPNSGATFYFLSRPLFAHQSTKSP
jgi:hypothetical protein